MATLRETSDRDLCTTGSARKKGEPGNFLLLVGMQYIQGFVGAVCKLPEPGIYPTTSSIIPP